MIAYVIGTFYLRLVIFGFAQDTEWRDDQPLIQFVPKCPETIAGVPILQLTTDVPGVATARCKNGYIEFPEINDAYHILTGAFNQSYVGENCLFYQKTGGNSFAVRVDFGWGEETAKIISKRRTFTVTCSYDPHGTGANNSEKIVESYLRPEEQQIFAGENIDVHFSIKLMNAVDEDQGERAVEVGKKYRLQFIEMTGNVTGFTVVSCLVKNAVSTYAILRAGCGDGVVFDSSSGFTASGNLAYSPFFLGFKLRGPDDIRFQCSFSICEANCDGSSCELEERKKRETKDGYNRQTGQSISSEPTLLTAESMVLQITGTGKSLNTAVRKAYTSMKRSMNKSETNTLETPETTEERDQVAHFTLVILVSGFIALIFLCLLVTMIICWKRSV